VKVVVATADATQRMWGPAAALPRGGGVTQKRAGRSDARAVPCQGRDLLALSQPIRF
jgi:hypothetical protein